MVRHRLLLCRFHFRMRLLCVVCHELYEFHDEFHDVEAGPEHDRQDVRQEFLPHECKRHLHKLHIRILNNLS